MVVRRSVGHLVERPKLMVVIFVAALVVYGLAIGYLSVSRARDRARIDQAVAKQVAQEAAAHQAEVTVCRRQVATAPTTLAIVSSLQDLIEARIESSRAAIEADPDSLLQDVRRRSIAQGVAALVALGKIDARLVRTTPTKEQCVLLAAKYGISNRKDEP